MSAIQRFRSMCCRALGHSWQTTHTNRYFIPTRQACPCGAVREWHGGMFGQWFTPERAGRE